MVFFKFFFFFYNGVCEMLSRLPQSVITGLCPERENVLRLVRSCKWFDIGLGRGDYRLAGGGLVLSGRSVFALDLVNAI